MFAIDQIELIDAIVFGGIALVALFVIMARRSADKARRDQIEDQSE